MERIEPWQPHCFRRGRVRPWLFILLATATVTLTIITTWLLRPTWLAYREQRAFEQEVLTVPLDDAAPAKLAKFARQAGLPGFAAAEVEKNGETFVPYYLSGRWYCWYRGYDSNDRASRVTRVFRLEIPLDNYQPQTETARNLVTRADQVNVHNTPSGAIEEPAIPLQREAARRLAFFWDFYELLRGGADTSDLRINYELIRSDPNQGSLR